MRAIAITLGIWLFSKTLVAASPMTFALHYNGAMRVDGRSSWISAEGEITNDTPAEFEKFVGTLNLWKDTRIALDSPGGSVIGGIRLGELIRKYKLITGVAKSVKNGEYSTPAPGECASACVFAFVGGVDRAVTSPSRIGIHQMSVRHQNLYQSNVVNVEELDKSFSTSQILMGLVISHFIEMGVDLNAASLMSQVMPMNIKWLSPDELVTTKIVYSPTKFSDWAIEPYKAGIIAFTRSLSGNHQMTLFCVANKMQFRFVANGPPYVDADRPYANNFLSSVENIDAVEIVGFRILKSNFKISENPKGIVIAGNLVGIQNDPLRRSTMSLFGETSGAIADLFSMYGFNDRGFQVSLNLAKRNCIS